jgi:hypothetical protein
MQSDGPNQQQAEPSDDVADARLPAMATMTGAADEGNRGGETLVPPSSPRGDHGLRRL